MDGQIALEKNRRGWTGERSKGPGVRKKETRSIEVTRIQIEKSQRVNALPHESGHATPSWPLPKVMRW
ncbi:hypothetical protein GHT06_017278 [Daphnia sinensis]|uniref:Uncharacterized protein n=1 Tax=Daphnia sinensis TaxID=1820382 RepID=A0AAD5L8U6_9CRUS|nr:hypothetical protein GHT06_017278 [Daphnia sinensis]